MTKSYQSLKKKLKYKSRDKDGTMEIIEKHWTKQEILKRLSDLNQQKSMMNELDADTSEIDILITNWLERYHKL